MEKTNYYAEYRDELILRDVLATDRTILANERTLLSYIRVFLNFIITGISILKIFNDLSIKILGIIFISISFVFLVIGIIRYLKINKDLKFIK